MTWRTALKRNGLWHRGRVWSNSHKSLTSSLFGLKQQWWKSVNRSSYYSSQAKGQESEVSTLLCGAVELTEPLVFQMLLVHYLTAEKQMCGDQETHYVDNLLFYIQHMHLFPQALWSTFTKIEKSHITHMYGNDLVELSHGAQASQRVPCKHRWWCLQQLPDQDRTAIPIKRPL